MTKQTDCDLRFGPARAFVPVVPPMLPQQVPCFRYVEVPIEQAGAGSCPIVSLDEYEAAGDNRGQ